MAGHLPPSEEKRIEDQIEKLKKDPYANVAVQNALASLGKSHFPSRLFEDPKLAITDVESTIAFLGELAEGEVDYPGGLVDYVTILLLELYKRQLVQKFLEVTKSFWETERKKWNDAVYYLRVYVPYAHWSPVANLADPEGVDSCDEAEQHLKLFVGLDKLSVQSAYDKLNHCHNESWWEELIEKLAEGPDDLTFRATLREKLCNKRQKLGEIQ